MSIPEGFKLVPVATVCLRDGPGYGLTAVVMASAVINGSVKPGDTLYAAPTPPQPIYDEVPELSRMFGAAIEMLRTAGIANQGSNAYNRAIVNLHEAVTACAQSRAKSMEVAMSEVKISTGHPDAGRIYAEALDRVTAERDAALGREAKLKEVTCFKDAVACVFDNLKMVACNTDDRAWDDRLEDLAEDVIEMAPEYKKQWKGICRLTAENHELQKRLTAAYERADVLGGHYFELKEAVQQLLSGAIDAYGAGEMVVQRADIDDLLPLISALKPAEGGGDEN